MIADLDLLVKDFDQIDVPDNVFQMRERLILLVDAHIADAGPAPEPSGPRIATAHRSGSLRDLWRNVRSSREAHDAGLKEWADVEEAVDEFFAWERHDSRLEVLKYSVDASLLRQKRQLLAELRRHDVYVLERGDIESYYPEEVRGRDKPSKAQDFCIKHSTREEVLAICPVLDMNELEQPQHEFEVIFGSIFEEKASQIPSQEF